ncbi:MAG: flagellar hook-basal body complex protein [Chloroflexi bacterium]|nr:flagellar hook-basal body complex protein [Chloroflexota bacterium]
MPSSLTQILHINRSGMLARLLDLDSVSHNLSNVNTTGFKSSRSNFQELLNDAVMGGTQLRATQRFMQQGSLRQTGNALDLAISGQGFFAVTMPDGRTAYTRDGQFTLDADRQIVNSSGMPLVWDGQIPEDATDVNVFPDGSVMVWQGNQWVQAGTIQTARFDNPNGLSGYGGNLWLETEVSGAAQMGTPGAEGYGQIAARTLEQSNVNLANEMTQMVALQRSFEMSLRAFQATDTMISQAIHMRK